MEYFVAEFTSDFNQHADILKFFRSLDVSNSYFVKSVAFGKELIRLQDIEKKFSIRPPTASIACGPDESMPTAARAESAAVVAPPARSLYLDLKPVFNGHTPQPPTRPFLDDSSLDSGGEDDDDIAPTPTTANTTTTHSETPTQGEDWRWMCHDLSSDSDEDEDDDAKPMTVKEEKEVAKKETIAEQKDYEECAMCSARHHSASKDVRYKLFNHALSHIDKDLYGDRFYCYKCDFSTMKYDPMQQHSKKNNHGFADRTKETVAPDFIRECASLFSKCYPSQSMPDRFSRTLEAVEREAGRYVEEEIDENKEKCQVCYRTIVRKPMWMFYHSVNHLDSDKFGAAFQCNDCKLGGNGYQTLRTHCANDRHTYTNRCFEANEAELVRESARLMRQCFPGGELPIHLKQAVTAVGELSTAEQTTTPNARKSLANLPKTSSCKKRPSSSFAGPSAKKWKERVEVHCKVCDSTLSSDRRHLSSSLFAHSTSHVDHTVHGKRYKCPECGDSMQRSVHICDGSSHSCVDRAKDSSEREFVTECLAQFERCFPGQELPLYMREKRLEMEEEEEEKAAFSAFACKECSAVVSTKFSKWECVRHALQHVEDEGKGKRFECTGCGEQKVKRNAPHFNANGHTAFDRLQRREYLRASVAMMERCFPDCSLPKGLFQSLPAEDENTLGDPHACKQCERVLVSKSNEKKLLQWQRFGHAISHVDTDIHGRRFLCLGCGIQRASNKKDHFNKTDHICLDRAQDASHPEYVLECVRQLSVSFPGCELPQAVQATLRAIETGHERGEGGERREQSTPLSTPRPPPKHREVEQAAGTPAAEIALQCQMCPIVLHTTNKWHTFSHAALHIDEEKFGGRYKCSGCGEIRSRNFKNSHFNKKDHIAVDRARDPLEREFVVECARVSGACFPGCELPPAVLATLHLARGGGELEDRQKEQGTVEEENERAQNSVHSASLTLDHTCDDGDADDYF